MLITVIIALSINGISARTIDNSGNVGGNVKNASNGETIYVNGGTYSNSNGNNVTNITINKNLTFKGGANRTATIFDAKGQGWFFIVTNGNTLTLINITFKNGKADGGRYGGGAIYVYNGSLNVSYSSFVNNFATGGDGGAIYVYSGGSLNVSYSSFVNNFASFGGAIDNEGGNFSVVNSSFVNNSAAFYGGAIYNNGANFSVVNSSFVNNSVILYEFGGAIYNYGYHYSGNCSVVNCSFVNNSATTGGGAIYNYGGNFSVVNSSFVNNSAYGNGGAIYNTGGNFSVVNSSFVNNSATSYGGAIYNAGGGNFSVVNCSFVNNSAQNQYGGAIYNYGANLSVVNSSFSVNSARIGGAVGVGNGVVNITGCNFLSDSAVTGNEIAAIIYSGVPTNITLYFNYNRVVNDLSGYVVYISSSSSRGDVTADIDYNWWGKNNYSSNVAPNNYYVMKFTSKGIITGKKVGDTITVDYDLVLNGTTDDTTGVENLPIFSLTLSCNGKVLKTIADARKAQTFNLPTLATKNTFKAQADYGIRLIDANATKLKTTVKVTTKTVKQGKKTYIQVTVKDERGNAVAGKKVTITFNGKTYTGTTNSKGVATFKIVASKAGKHKITAKYAGDEKYAESSKTAKQVVKARVDLAIMKVKKLKSKNKEVVVYKITIKNLGGKKSKATTLNIQHFRKDGFKSKIKVTKVKALKPGQKVTYKITSFPDKQHNKKCYKEAIILNPKKTQDEITYKNNKKVIYKNK